MSAPIIRGFHQNSRAWYGGYVKDGAADRFSVGLYHPEGGTVGEMQFVFQALGGRVVPRLKCFDDGWYALSTFADLIARMGQANDKNITPEDFRKMLLECGFTDLTKELP
jgi:hypothetical protein